MADDKLVKAMQAGIASGLSEEQIKQRLIRDGWNAADVNGAYGLHVLSHKPIGSNLMSAWKEHEIDKKKSAIAQFFQTVGLAGILLIALVVVDWYGYSIPFLSQYSIRNYIEAKVPPTYLPAIAKVGEASTTPQK